MADDAKRRRIGLWLVVALCDLTLGVRTARDTRSLLVGAIVVVGFAGGLALVTVVARWLSEARLARARASGRSLALDAVLDYRSMPEPWSGAAAETIGWAGRMSPGMAVRLTLDGQAIRIEKSRRLGWGKQPFTLNIPLTAVSAVRTQRAQNAVAGSSLTLVVDGVDVTMDVVVGRETIDSVARDLEAAVAKARLMRPE